MLSRRGTSTQSLLNHALRGALVLVCLYVALGNSLAVLLLNAQSTLVCQTLPTEEIPVEEAPIEAELPLELGEFTSHSVSDSQRRRVAAALRTFFCVDIFRGRLALRATRMTTRAVMQLRNGCGATLRC